MTNKDSSQPTDFSRRYAQRLIEAANKNVEAERIATEINNLQYTTGEAIGHDLKKQIARGILEHISVLVVKSSDGKQYALMVNLIISKLTSPPPSPANTGGSAQSRK
jgi:hypothetical protein